MGTPWETIIKMYRQNLKDQRFDTLKEYQEDFILFLRSKRFFTDEAYEKYNIYEFLIRINNLILNEIIRDNPMLIPSNNTDHSAIIRALENKIDEHCNSS